MIYQSIYRGLNSWCQRGPQCDNLCQIGVGKGIVCLLVCVALQVFVVAGLGARFKSCHSDYLTLGSVIQNCVTMKTATVCDLRNRFANVAKMIEEGESVSITRHGATFATLSPASPQKSGTANWAKRLAVIPDVGRKMSKAKADALWKALRD